MTWEGRDIWSNDPAPGVGGVTGWFRKQAVDYTALTSTAWTNSDEGTQPVVDGVTFDITSLSGNASVGGGSGLATDDTTAVIHTVLGAGDLSGHEIIGFAWAVEDVGATIAAYLGDAANTSWALVRTATGTIQPQRRTSTVGFSSISYNHNQATAFLILGAVGSTDVFFRQDVVDPANLPAPDDSGWLFLGSAHNITGPVWPFVGSDGRLIFQTAGAATHVIDGWQLFTIRE